MDGVEESFLFDSPLPFLEGPFFCNQIGFDKEKKGEPGDSERLIEFRNVSAFPSLYFDQRREPPGLEEDGWNDCLHMMKKG